MSAHTEGRMVVRVNGDANSYALLDDKGIWWTSLLMNGEKNTERQLADLRRLAACWNAFEGLPTEAVEQIKGLRAYHAEMTDNIAEKSELLARSVAMLGEASGHVRKVEAERDQLRAELSEMRTMRDATQALAEAAYTLLADVLNDGVSMGLNVDTVVRIRELLDGAPATATIPDSAIDHPAVAKSIVEGAANALLQDVANLGMVLTITQRPLHPYAMGNYETVVNVRPARERAL